MYLVERFHQFLPKRGSHGRGLVQFFGPRAKRRRLAGKKWPAWEVGPAETKHTLELGGDLTVKPREKK